MADELKLRGEQVDSIVARVDDQDHSIWVNVDAVWIAELLESVSDADAVTCHDFCVIRYPTDTVVWFHPQNTPIRHVTDQILGALDAARGQHLDRSVWITEGFVELDLPLQGQFAIGVIMEHENTVALIPIFTNDQNAEMRENAWDVVKSVCNKTFF